MTIPAPAHTPGPWTVHPRFPEHIVPLAHCDRPVGASVHDAYDLEHYAQEVATLQFCKRHRTAEEISANARLIAAAPALLAALQGLMPTNLGKLPDTMPDSATLPLDVTFGELRAASAALALALGEQ